MNLKDKAIQQLQVAEHLLNVTFPLVKDPKLLMGIIQNLNSSINHAINSYFHQKQVVPKTFNSKLDYLRDEHNLSTENIELVRRISGLVEFHQKSPVVFRRGSKQIICNEEYNIEVISAKEIRNLLDKTKTFFSEMGI